MRLVVDTNVLLSALMSSASSSAHILALWRRRKFDLLTCAEQIHEITRVTRYSKIRVRLAPALAGRLVNQLREAAIVVGKLPRVDRSPDPDDNYLLALADAGKAQFLVTGDRPLLRLEFYKSTQIITPAALAERITPRGLRHK
jgi:putative PIN family toxin of toxin-antitoxin system